jgi:hypothetical protein
LVHPDGLIRQAILRWRGTAMPLRSAMAIGVIQLRERVSEYDICDLLSGACRNMARVGQEVVKDTCSVPQLA